LDVFEFFLAHPACLLRIAFSFIRRAFPRKMKMKLKMKMFLTMNLMHMHTEIPKMKLLSYYLLEALD